MALADRTGALVELNKLLTETARGRGQVAFVRGPVASGKTTLLHWLAEHAIRRGFTYLGGGGCRSERHLPLGVLEQLFQRSSLDPGFTTQVDSLMRDAYEGDRAADADETAEVGLSPSGTWELHRALLSAVRLRPLLIGIDDVQHVDLASLRWLLYVARRIQASKIAIVFNERDGEQSADPLLHADLLRQSHCLSVQLPLLSEQGVTEMLSEKLGRRVASDVAAECHAITGGNPLLVRAVVDDYPGVPREAPGLHVGDSFNRAVATCIYRSDPVTVDIAAAVAVLDGSATPAVLARMTGVDVHSIGQVLGTLEHAGLLVGHRFRHPAAQAAALRHLTPEARAHLRRHAAHLLHDDGAPPTVVAEKLLASGRKVDEWAIDVLIAAARLAVAEDDTSLAVAYLKLAQESCGDDARRVTITARLADVEWRLDPAMSARRLGELTTALRRGQLSGRQAVTTIRHLLWHGQVDTAVDALQHLSRDTGKLDVETAAELHAARLELSCTFPSHAPALAATRESLARMKVTSVVVGQQIQAVSALNASLRPGQADGAAAAAEHVLQRVTLGDATVAAVVRALVTLVTANHLDKATTWCEALIAEAGTRQVPSWQAFLAGIRAEIALRKGQLEAAEAHARAALRHIAPESWGVAVGAPLATLISAATAMGKDADAARALGEPVPAAMFQSVYGLRYLRARGMHYLAIKRYGEALSDFQACGAILSDWDMDLPVLAPWRMDIAEVYLRLGLRREARELVEEELGRITSQDARHYGLLMRLAAATSDLPQRPHLLTDAAQLLESSGDRLQLAWALADLGTAYQALGHASPAAEAFRRAHRTATECRAYPLERHLRTVAGSALEEAAPRADDGPEAVELLPDTVGADIDVDVLSDAERRVAALAVRGHTNREIAGRLYITISTVEQHLTRVYRKLKVHRRRDLPVALQAQLSDIA